MRTLGKIIAFFLVIFFNVVEWIISNVGARIAGEK